jgi:preprotein translocase subunit SecA
LLCLDLRSNTLLLNNRFPDPAIWYAVEMFEVEATRHTQTLNFLSACRGSKSASGTQEPARQHQAADHEICERITAAADRKMAEKSLNSGPDLMRMAEKSLLLQLLDQTWKDHLLTLDHLRQGI